VTVLWVEPEKTEERERPQVSNKLHHTSVTCSRPVDFLPGTQFLHQ